MRQSERCLDRAIQRGEFPRLLVELPDQLKGAVIVRVADEMGLKAEILLAVAAASQSDNNSASRVQILIFQSRS
jgi:hypothetical protein